MNRVSRVWKLTSLLFSLFFLQFCLSSHTSFAHVQNKDPKREQTKGLHLKDLTPLQKKILLSADSLLNGTEITYLYGGKGVSSEADCKNCLSCAEKYKKHGKINSQFKKAVCPICDRCALDCSHFVHQIYQEAGLQTPYLTTNEMLASSPGQLLKHYRLVDLGRNLNKAASGDLLVYNGHVVLLERVMNRDAGNGDIVHATSGKEFRGFGEGIQRERNVSLGAFRGPLQRILRPVQLN